MKIHLLLLGAGEGRRFGGLKQLTDIHGQPMIQYCLDICVEAGIGDVSVSLGANLQKIAPRLSGYSSIIEVVNWREGMNESIRAGICSLDDDVSHVLIALADQINVKASQLRELHGIAEANPEHIVAAKYTEQLGVPAVFPKKYFGALTELAPGRGAKNIINNNMKMVIGFDVPEAAFDIDTRQDKEDWEKDQKTYD